MMKSIDFASKGKPLAILSVTASENVEGYIYVEAYKEIHVKEAIQGLSIILGGKTLLVPQDEMNVIYRNDKLKDTELKQYQWVRIKTGQYNNDLGMVEKINENKAIIRLIPRIENPSKEVSHVEKNNKSKNGANDKYKNKFVRIPQKVFNPEAFKFTEIKKMPDLDKDCYFMKK